MSGAYNSSSSSIKRHVAMPNQLQKSKAKESTWAEPLSNPFFLFVD
jgi:hypothetical protein